MLNQGNMNLKKFEISPKHETLLKLCFINKKKVFVYTQESGVSSYLVVPEEVLITRENNNICFFFNKINSKSVLNFLFLFNKLILKNEKSYCKKLILKGLGYRIAWLENENILRFKIGFSHMINIFVPVDKINIFVKKNVVYVRGYDVSILGNFCKKIKDIKYPNTYTGKGFWYKNESKHLKTFKKQ